MAIWLAIWLFQNDDILVDERFRVEFVVLDVLATTKRGELISDLSIEDFIVTENRQKVDITYFEILDLRVPEVDQTDEVLKVAADPQDVPQIILVLDLDSVEHFHLLDAFDQTRKFLAELGEQHVLLCLYSLQNGNITDGFVSDTNVALLDFDQYVDRTYARMFDDRGEPFSEMKGEYQSQSLGSRTPSGMLSGAKNMSDIADAFQQCHLFGGGAAACIQDTLNQILEEQELRALRVINQIESLMYKFQETDGLKMIYFVSPGFSVRAPQAPQQLARAHLNKIRGDRSGADPMSRFYGGYKLEDEYQRVVHGFVRNRVIFHTVDMFNGKMTNRIDQTGFGSVNLGSSVSGIEFQFQMDMDSGLEKLADDSGGSFHQVRMIPELIANSIKNNRLFYVLGYTSPSTEPGRFRDIRIKCKRKGVKLAHRKGYLGAS